MKQAFYSHKATIMRLARTVWFFPALVFVTLLALTACGVSGTSVGHYHELLFGQAALDTSLIAGEPRDIRSDEWGVNTPLTLSQVKEGFPTVNQTTGNGQDMSMTFDVPYKDWSTIFRPQNWSFFILPPENAFAFKWWFTAAALILAGYTFILAILPKRYLLASLLSVSFAASPFLHWWYQSGVFLSLAYALLICALITSLASPKKISRSRLVWHLAALSYIMTAFAFIFYAPFLLPIVLVASAFLVGELFSRLTRQEERTELLRRLVWLVIPIVLSGSFTIIFLVNHSQVLDALGSSVYPGQRTEPSGGYSLIQLFGGFYNSSLQNDNQAAHYSYNQSEASNFMLLSPFLLPFFAYYFVKRKSLRLPINWSVITLLAIALFFAIRLFVSPSEILFNLLQINRIPHNRLLIGFGLLNFLLVLVAIRQLTISKITLPRQLIYGSTAFAFVSVAAIGIGLRINHPGYISTAATILLTAVTISAIVYLLLSKRIVSALVLLVALSLSSTYRINPIYQGLGILTDSRLATAIHSLNDTDDKWVVGDHAAAFESLPSAVGARSLSGVYAYPQNDIWDDIGTDPQTRAVYNRYAHVFFTVGDLKQPSQDQGAYFDPPALDAFRVHADACSDFLAKQQVRFVVLTETNPNRCLRLVKTVPYPKLSFYIYEIKR